MPNFYKIEISPILNMSEDPYFDFDKDIVKKKMDSGVLPFISRNKTTAKIHSFI